MKNKIIFIISVVGILGGIVTAIFSSFVTPALPPAFNPAASPYTSAIYAEGIVESAQTSGENINIYPEVAGTVKEILVSEGQQVKAGQPLLRLDDSIQRATAEQLGSQAQAAEAHLGRAESGAEKRNPRCQRRASGFCRGHLENRPGYFAERRKRLTRWIRDP